MDRNVGRVAVVMTVIMGLEAWPLSMIAFGPHGMARIAALLGFGAEPAPILAWAGAAGVALAYCLASMSSLPLIRQRLFDLNALKLLAIPFALITGLFEEVFFRRWLMDWAQGQSIGIGAQIAISAGVFGLAHGVWGLFGRNLRSAFGAMAFTSVLGAGLAIVYLAAARQVAPAAWSHIAINLVIEPWLLLAVMRERGAPRSPSNASPPRSGANGGTAFT